MTSMQAPAGDSTPNGTPASDSISTGAPASDSISTGAPASDSISVRAPASDSIPTGAPVAPRAYADPYLAGVGLGVVLLAAFVVAGRGLGASGAFASTAAAAVAAVSPGRAAQSPVFTRYLETGGPLREWLVFEVAGVAIGGFLSAWHAGRLRLGVDGGPRVARRVRLALAFGGGSVMGMGAVLARGCTSGLALTGGALLSVGSWLFMLAAFAGGYLVAPFLKRVWR